MNRKILYGYQIQNGEIAVHPEEADVVGRVFNLYLERCSYQQIADALNGENIPFSPDAPLWNKHKIKRLLENSRYTGKDGYPTLVDTATYRDVQARIAEKTANHATKAERPARKLCLICECCGGRLLQRGGPNHRMDTLYLTCKDCGSLVTITDAALLGEVVRQLAEHAAPAVGYAPNEEVIRLTNAVNRGLEHPDTPEDLVALVLQGISARYVCCPAAPLIENNNRLTDVDWSHYRQAVSHITLSTQNVVTVSFKQE